MPKKNLIIDNFQERTNFVQKEHEILAFWDEAKIFEKSVSFRSQDKRYVFYDGPPFATGTPHYGHILASTIKDVIPRYWTMKGYRVDRVWGWDCHGIPIENMIEKELGLKGGKKGIEEMGIGKFNDACRAAILRFDKEWEAVIRRIGRWVDFTNSYKTMDTTFMESVWWAFAQLYKKGLVYEGRKVILYCPRCATPLSNFEIAMDNSYKEINGPSTTYKYKVVELKDTYFLAWSTTPWNKLATPALAVNPRIQYVLVQQGQEKYILAESRLGMLKAEPYEVKAKYLGKDLEQFNFELHYDFYPRKNDEKAGVIVADDYVTDLEGTGIVTLAVYGEDDFRVMSERNIQKIEHVDSEGMLKPEVTPWAGMFMLKVNPLVNDDLAKRNLIYLDEQRLHSVPVCYRCETRLYHAPVPAWFIDVQKIKQDLIKQNEQINWFPEHLKHGRFGKGLETAPDWNISRSRYWGTPMPIWQSQIETNSKYQEPAIRIIESLEELKKWAVNPEKVENIKDIHRQYIDNLELWVDDAKTIKGKRIPEVFDCWIESGSMPYASIHYPFENKKQFEDAHPAQFIAEYIAQTRAWFYTLHVMSVGLFGNHTFENAVTTGTIQAEDGQKMSKSKKNYPDPALVFEKYGVDSLRFYLMGSVVMKAENLNFSEKQVAEVFSKIISLAWNTFSFYKLYAGNEKQNFSNVVKHDLDLWIESKTQKLLRDVTSFMDGYDTVGACRSINLFIDELSTWYLRRSRERFKKDSESMLVFGNVLKMLSLVLAPIAPFISELMYQNLNPSQESVHLEDWPLFEEVKIDEKLEQMVETSRTLVEGLHAIRKQANIPVKQVLGNWWYECSTEIDWNNYSGVFESILEEVNVKTFVKDSATRKKIIENGNVESINVNSKILGEIKVFLHTEIGEELKLEGKVRELIRSIQIMRKEQKLTVQQEIKLVLPTEFKVFSKDQLDQIQRDTVVSDISWGESLKISIG